MLSYISFAWKGTLTDARDGDEGGEPTNHMTTPRSHFFFLYVSPQKGTLTVAGDGDGGRQKNKFQKQYIYSNIFYTILCILYICILCIFCILYIIYIFCI